MNKNQFLNELYSYLGSLSNSEKADIMRDFDEHFREGASAGKTEEQICFELGSPLECAKQYVGEGVTVVNKVSRPAYPNPTNRPKSKYLWSLAFFLNLIEAIFSLPIAFSLFCVGTILVVLDFYLIPTVSFVPFTVLSVSLTLAVFLGSIIFLLLTAYVLKIMIKKINGEVRA